MSILSDYLAANPALGVEEAILEMTHGHAVATYLQGTKAVTAAGTAESIWTTRAQITSVTAIADVAGSLGGKYFDLQDENGPVRCWIDVDDGSTAPAIPADGRLIEIDISAGDANTVVASAIATALDADSKFAASAAAAVVTVTNSTAGEIALAPGAGTSGFTVAVTTPGRNASKLVKNVEILARKNKTTANTGNIYLGDQYSQTRVIAAGGTVNLIAPDGKMIDLASIWIDAATSADAVVFTSIG